ncbi:MAG: hypothetical protein OXC05_06945 [Halieaceae bacterium]|nr:hypothetical protein [Halieaceae bacterium]
MSAYSKVAGPKTASRTLSADEIRIQPLGFANGWEYLYSSPYPDGRRTIIAGGRDRIVKLDTDSLAVIHTLPIGEGSLEPEENYHRFVADMDRLVREVEQDPAALQTFLDRAYADLIPALQTGAGTIYKILSRDNTLYLTVRDLDSGQVFVEAYGDVNADEFESPLELKRRFPLPRGEGDPSIPMAVNMTFDGHVVVVTSDGRVFILSRDLELKHSMTLPEARAAAGNSADWMAGIVRNGVSVDDEGGIYVVSRSHLHRVQWTGESLSLEPEEGAWTMPYHSGVNGSGTTPTPIGWGEGADHLLATLDGGDGVLVLWRDEIPLDWEGLEGYPRRVAGVAILDLGDGTPADMHMEASPVASGYGFFWQNDTPKVPLPDQQSLSQKIFAKYSSVAVPKYQVTGGVKYEWDPKTRKLGKAWVTETRFAPNICAPNVNGLLYCVGVRDHDYTIEVLDWETGGYVYHLVLGSSIRFNPMAVVTRIAPNGSIDTSSLGAGIMRISTRGIGAD